MKRCRFGAAALAALLILGLLSSRWMGRHCGSLARIALQAAEAAQQEDWDAANDQITLIRQRWETRRSFAAVLSDHAQLDAVDSLLAILGPGARRATFRDNALRLAQALAALKESQTFSWSNLL